MNYKQAYDKIIDAYFRNEIKPFKQAFCFCGTLCDNQIAWAKDTLRRKHNDYANYLGIEYVKMERALLDGIKAEDGNNYINPCDSNYEAALFAGMSAALDVLKEIHRARGEDVDGVEVFRKRNLITQ